MPLSDQDILNIQKKVQRYKEVLQNTQRYRKAWTEGLKNSITDHLRKLTESGELDATIEIVGELQNLEAVVLSLGTVESGLGEFVGNGLHRDLIKQNGSLVYQQLFNGKILVVINFPSIDKYGQPQPPKTLAIYRPEELKEPFFQRHFETFITDMTAWEDYDDDLTPEPNHRIGFKMNFERENS